MTGEKADRAAEDFRRLPTDLQTDLVLLLNEDLARQFDREALSFNRFDLSILTRIPPVVLFAITSFWPSQGVPGAWSYAFGRGFNSDCKVFFDGVQVESRTTWRVVRVLPELDGVRARGATATRARRTCNNTATSTNTARSA